MNNEQINKKVQNTIEVWSNIDNLEPDPFLFTRVKAEINGRNNKRKNLLIILRPVFFILVIFLNIITFYAVLHKDKIKKYDSEQSVSTLRDYYCASSSYVQLFGEE